MKKNRYSINLVGCFFCFFLLSFFSFQSNAYTAAASYYDTVQRIYIGYYQRAADPGGLIYWADRLDKSGGNLNEIIEAYANSAESQALYGTINSSNISNVVNGIYNALFGRPAEPEGLNYYVAGFNSGQFTPATIMLNVLYGAQNEDLQSVNNKLTAANLFTRTIDPELDGTDFQVTYAGDGDAIAGRNFLALSATSVIVPTQAETTAYIKANIANPGDTILSYRNEQLSGQYFAAYYQEKTGTLPVNILTANITVDGNAADWANISPFIVDPSGNTVNNPPAGTDITNVYVAKNATRFFCRIDLADGAPNPTAPVVYRFYFWETAAMQYPLRFLHAYYGGNPAKWRVELRETLDGITAPVISTAGLIGVGSTFLEMSIPLADLGSPSRRFLQARTRTSPGGVATNHDLTDILDGRFLDAPNESWRENVFGTSTFNGNGNWTFTGTRGSNATGGNVALSDSGTYDVSADGTVAISGASLGGWQFGMGKDSKMVIGAAINDAEQAQGIGVIFKKGGVHSLVNREGNFVTFNKDNAADSCQFGNSVIDDLGNLTTTYTQNHSSAGISPGTSSGTYTREIDGSGTTTSEQGVGSNKTIPMVYNGATRDDEVFSVNVKLDNRNKNRQRISLTVKKAAIPPTNASLVGKFFVTFYQDDQGVRRGSGFGIMTFDGVGAWTVEGTQSSSDEPDSGSFSASGTYSFAADGTLTLQNDSGGDSNTGALSEDGTILIFSQVSNTDQQFIALAVKAE